jgi:hypothetical protein
MSTKAGCKVSTFVIELYVGGKILKNCNVFRMECLLYKRAPILNENMCWKVYFKKGDVIMVRSIDFKSVLIGGFVVAMVLCLVGAVRYVSPEQYGRFQIETNDNYAFILDSATGQVWSEEFPYHRSGLIVYPDPNFHAPKTHPHSTTEP